MKLLGFLLLIITCFNAVVNSQNVSSSKKFDFYVQVFFKNDDSFIFSYHDSTYHNSFVKFDNKKWRYSNCAENHFR